MSISDPNQCSSCKRQMRPGETRHVEMGWVPGDFDCDECYKTWPEREWAAVGGRPDQTRKEGR